LVAFVGPQRAVQALRCHEQRLLEPEGEQEKHGKTNRGTIYLSHVSGVCPIGIGEQWCSHIPLDLCSHSWIVYHNFQIFSKGIFGEANVGNRRQSWALLGIQQDAISQQPPTSMAKST
jgi:hypothetical protein